jgi:hypothetical protein
VYFQGFTHRVNRPVALNDHRPIVLGEAAAGQPAPIVAWFPYGEASGHEFLYPRR